MGRGWVVVLVAVVVVGCSAPPEAVRPAVSQPSSTAPSPAFNATDVAWLQLAEALHARALPVLELAPGRSGDREVKALAERLHKAHGTGRGRLRALLVRAGAAGENPHAEHDMPGMPTAADLRALGAARDDAFDRRFVGLVRAYLDQLVLVAKGEQGAGGAAEVRELAAEMAREHAAELAALARLGK